MSHDAMFPSGSSAAVVVAHPDDETIWCGGFILQRPEWDWTIVSLCRASDADRAPKFHAVCAHLGARGVIFDVDDSSPLEAIDPRRDIGQPVIDALGGRRWELLLTHGRNGEYGHPRHIEVHHGVVSLVAEGKLACERLYGFACQADVASKRCEPAEDADMLVDLGPDTLAEKRRIVRELYGFDEQSFEVQACISPEGFRQIHLPINKGADA